MAGVYLRRACEEHRQQKFYAAGKYRRHCEDDCHLHRNFIVEHNERANCGKAKTTRRDPDGTVRWIHEKLTDRERMRRLNYLTAAISRPDETWTVIEEDDDAETEGSDEICRRAKQEVSASAERDLKRIREISASFWARPSAPGITPPISPKSVPELVQTAAPEKEVPPHPDQEWTDLGAETLKFIQSHVSMPPAQLKPEKTAHWSDSSYAMKTQEERQRERYEQMMAENEECLDEESSEGSDEWVVSEYYD